MPDRAVVAQKHRDHCQRMLSQSAGMTGPEWDFARESWQRCLADAEQERLASRAIVALSDDRQWLAMLRPAPEEHMWLVYRFHPLTLELIPQRPAIRDTGQDAHQMLAAWMEGSKNDRCPLP